MHIWAMSRTASVIAIGLLALYTNPAKACETLDCKPIALAQSADQADQPEQSDAVSAPEATVEPGTSVKKNSRHARKSTRSGKPGKLASQSSASEKRTVDSGKSTEPNNSQSNSDKPGIASSVANANAWMAGVTKTADERNKSLPEQSGLTNSTATDYGMQSAATPEQVSTSNADAEVVASDQLNDLDRAAPQPAYSASSGTDDSWNQASMIGKIFIAFGGFLTLASAARLLIV